MRCGSTWLCEVLKTHPDVRISDRKEMDYFFMRRMLWHDLAWYAEHFKPQPGGEPKPVRGEISPLYARLKKWQVERIARLLPELRIVFTLRHPIERVWSQALYEFGFRAKRDLGKVRTGEFLRQLERARSKLSSDYLRTITIWSGAFGREALHIGLFDELCASPDTYINEVLKHISASTPWSVPDSFIKKKVWATKGLVKQERDIPEIVQWYVADQLLDSMERLNLLLEGRVSSWVEEMRSIRGRTKMSWRIRRELNRAVFSIPENLAYEAYHVVLDARLWKRWKQLRESSNGSAIEKVKEPALPPTGGKRAG